MKIKNQAAIIALLESGKIGLPAGWTLSETIYLAEKWDEKNDYQLALELDKEDFFAIRKARYALGLKGGPGKKPGVPNFHSSPSTIKASVNDEWLRFVIEEQGYSYAEVASIFAEKGIPVSREWIRCICHQKAITPRKDNPFWYGRKHGVPENLISRSNLAEELQKANGVSRLSTGLRRQGIMVSTLIIRVLAEMLRVDEDLFPYHAPRVLVSCANCGKEIKRPPYLIRKKQKDFFCNNSCKGRWLGKNFGFKHHGSRKTMPS